jgi:hypothetical protein
MPDLGIDLSSDVYPPDSGKSRRHDGAPEEHSIPSLPYSIE